MLSTALVEKDIHTFQDFLDADASKLERITAKGPPFGSRLKESIARVPLVRMKTFEHIIGLQSGQSASKIAVDITLDNFEYVSKLKQKVFGGASFVLYAKQENSIIFMCRIFLWQLLQKETKIAKVFPRRANGSSVTIVLRALDSVGLDAVHEVADGGLSHNAADGGSVEGGVASSGAKMTSAKRKATPRKEAPKTRQLTPSRSTKAGTERTDAVKMPPITKYLTPIQERRSKISSKVSKQFPGANAVQRTAIQTKHIVEQSTQEHSNDSSKRKAVGDASCRGPKKKMRIEDYIAQLNSKICEPNQPHRVRESHPVLEGDEPMYGENVSFPSDRLRMVPDDKDSDHVQPLLSSSIPRQNFGWSGARQISSTRHVERACGVNHRHRVMSRDSSAPSPTSTSQHQPYSSVRRQGMSVFEHHEAPRSQTRFDQYEYVPQDARFRVQFKRHIHEKLPETDHEVFPSSLQHSDGASQCAIPSRVAHSFNPRSLSAQNMDVLNSTFAGGRFYFPPAVPAHHEDDHPESSGYRHATPATEGARTQDLQAPADEDSACGFDYIFS